MNSRIILHRELIAYIQLYAVSYETWRRYILLYLKNNDSITTETCLSCPPTRRVHQFIRIMCMSSSRSRLSFYQQIHGSPARINRELRARWEWKPMVRRAQSKIGSQDWNTNNGARYVILSYGRVHLDNHVAATALRNLVDHQRAESACRLRRHRGEGRWVEEASDPVKREGECERSLSQITLLKSSRSRLVREGNTFRAVASPVGFWIAEWCVLGRQQ